MSSNEKPSNVKSSNATSSKVNLLGLTRTQLQAFFHELGEKDFRVQQVMKWIHQVGVDNFEDMTNLSKSLRSKLNDIAEIKIPEIAYKEFSQDGTRKWVLKLDEFNSVEMVLIPDGDRRTLCVSSQVGCSLDCSFCSTGKQGFQRDLTASEIIAQVLIAQNSYGPRKNLGERVVTNVVMMGMGEPLLNFDNVVSAMHIMKDDLGYGISKRRVTLSTSGVVPAMDRLSSEIDVALAVSLHAPNDALRNELVPINKKYPLKELLDACHRFLNSFDNTRRTITMEYVMLSGVNDLTEHAHELAELLKGLPVKINLIPFNPFPNSDYERSSRNAIYRFQKILRDAGYTTMLRTTRGDDIDAACGQLVGKVQDKTRRNERWRNKLSVKDLSDDKLPDKPE